MSVLQILLFFCYLHFFCTLLGRGRKGDRPCSKPPFVLIYCEWITLSKIVYRKIIDFHVSPLLPTLLHDSYTTVWKLRKFSPIFFSFFLQKFREINVIRTKLHFKLFPRIFFLMKVKFHNFHTVYTNNIADWKEKKTRGGCFCKGYIW